MNNTVEVNNSLALIDSYTREEALADGMLIDATELAAEHGFKYPVAITSSVRGRVREAEGVDGRSYDGVMRDILFMLHLKIKMSRAPGNKVYFDVLVYSQESRKDVLVNLLAVVGPGDNAEPVITIQFEGED